MKPYTNPSSPPDRHQVRRPIDYSAFDVRRRSLWDYLRASLILGIFGAAGFWIVRLIMWGMVYWGLSRSTTP
jgi:hypothetical protein